MPAEVDAWFIKDYKSDVFTAFQRQMSLTRDTVRAATVQGLTAVVPKVGTVTVGTKDRHGMVPVSVPDHSQVEWNVKDYYSGRWVDKLDLLKTNVDERQAAANTGAFAMARKVDEIVVTAARASLPSGQKITTTGGLTYDKAMAAKELLEEADVPDDGEIYLLVGPHQWSEMSKTPQFANTQWMPSDPMNERRRYNRRKTAAGITIINTGSLLKGFKSGNNRPCLMYHRSAVAFGLGADIDIDIGWVNERASWFFNHMMSGEAKRIEDTGVVEITCDDTSTLPT